MSLKNIFQKIRQNSGRDSAYDWYIALACFATLLVAMFIVNSWMFLGLTANTPTAQDIHDKKMISVSQTDIQKAIESMRRRDAGSKNTSATLLADPSL